MCMLCMCMRACVHACAYMCMCTLPRLRPPRSSARRCAARRIVRCTLLPACRVCASVRAHMRPLTDGGAWQALVIGGNTAVMAGFGTNTSLERSGLLAQQPDTSNVCPNITIIMPLTPHLHKRDLVAGQKRPSMVEPALPTPGGPLLFPLSPATLSTFSLYSANHSGRLSRVFLHVGLCQLCCASWRCTNWGCDGCKPTTQVASANYLPGRDASLFIDRL